MAEKSDALFWRRLESGSTLLVKQVKMEDSRTTLFGAVHGLSRHTDTPSIFNKLLNRLLHI